MAAVRASTYRTSTLATADEASRGGRKAVVAINLSHHDTRLTICRAWVGRSMSGLGPKRRISSQARSATPCSMSIPSRQVRDSSRNLWHSKRRQPDCQTVGSPRR